MKIGIIRTSSIGDVVLATACLDLIEKVCPKAEVVWVGRGASLQLVCQSYKNINGYDLPSRSNAKQRKDILNVLKGCNVVIDLQTSFRSRLVGFKLKRFGVPVVGARKFSFFRSVLVLRAWFFGRYRMNQKLNRSNNLVQYKMMLEAMERGLNYLKISTTGLIQDARPRLKVVDRAPLNWIRELSFGNWVAVSPGASFDTKKAPVEIFVDILNHLKSFYQQSDVLPNIVLLGGPEDRSVANLLADELSWPVTLINLSGKLSLSESLSALSFVRCLLSNDSGLSHMAESIGIPVAVLFGPTSEAFGFLPQLKSSQFFSSQIGCRPCSKHGKQKCRYGDKMCFRSLETKQVSKFIDSLMPRVGSQ